MAQDTSAERAFLWSRGALILVSLLVSVPSPAGDFWGGPVQGSVTLPLACGAAWAALSYGVARAARGSIASIKTQFAGLSLALDVIGLTALLSLSGAAQNPFTLLYFVPITLATVVAQKWTFRIAGISVLGFAFLVAQTAMALEGHRTHAHHSHFFQHVQGMVVALAVAGGFVTFFVHRIAESLSAQSRHIEALSREQQHNHFAIALGALSAGAAHELGSPLGTVQLLSEELPHMDDDERTRSIQTIVAEVQRMKAIVHSMDSTQLSADVIGDGSSWALAELVTVMEESGIAVPDPVPGRTSQPRKVVAQILRELIRNASHVTSEEGISVAISLEDEHLHICVSDDGPGLDEAQLRSATEPFVSHTGGTGLGLFLATVHARQLGGRLELASQPGAGTQATLILPRTPPTRTKE